MANFVFESPLLPLNYLSRMELDFLLLSIGPVHFRFKGCWVVLFFFLNSNFNVTFCKQVCGDPYQTPRFTASDLDLRCFPMS